jgi:hypothetical protein
MRMYMLVCMLLKLLCTRVHVDVNVLTDQSSWCYQDRKDMEMLTKFTTDEDFVEQESVFQYVSLVWEDWMLVRPTLSCEFSSWLPVYTYVGASFVPTEGVS